MAPAHFQTRSEGPPTTRTPFHLLPLSFSLSPASLSSLSTTQLALTWIAPHPDWVEHTHWSLLFAEWRKRRERSKVERGRGNERDEDEDEEWGEDAMDRMRMDWKIPDELEKLDSAQLGALPMHPDFHPLLVEEARRVFCTRRERDLAPVPSPSPPPRQKRSSRPPQRRQNSPPVQWNNPEFVPRDFTCRWTTIFVGSVLSTLPHSVVWALLSPPNLPEPVAIRLIHKERGSPKTFALCFVAYESKREAVEACRGLDGAEYGDGEKQYRLVPEMSDKPAQAVTWEWVTAREDFRQRFEPGHRQRREAELSREYEERQPVEPFSPARPTGERVRGLPSTSPPSLPTHSTPSSDETASSAPLPPPSPSPLSPVALPATQKPAQSSLDPVPSSPTSSREDFLRATLLARKRDREVKKKTPSSKQDAVSDSSLPHKPSFPSPFPRPPSRPRAMRLAGIDHELLSQQASSSFPLSSSLSRFIAGLPRRTNAPADTTALSVLRQAAQSSRVPSSPA